MLTVASDVGLPVTGMWKGRRLISLRESLVLRCMRWLHDLPFRTSGDLECWLIFLLITNGHSAGSHIGGMSGIHLKEDIPADATATPSFKARSF